MAVAIQVPFEQAAGEIRVRLDGRFYRLNLSWNTRDRYWALSLSRDDGTALIQGMRVTLGVNMLRQFVGSGFPPGALVAVDTRGQGEAPGRRDLQNGRVQLIYRTEAEVADA